MSRVKKFLELSGADKRTFLAALYGLPKVDVQLRLYGFEKTLAKLQRIPLAPEDKASDPATYPTRTSLLVNAAARFLFRREACLQRSLMLWFLLRKKGIESELKIGVATEDQKLQAHAWLEIDGAAVNESPHIHEQFNSFTSSFITDYRNFS